MRCFIAVELPEEAKEKAVQVQQAIRKFIGRKLTEKENLHLTLKFLGECSEETAEEVKNKLRQIKHEPFKADASGLGVFKKPAVRIVWLKISGAEELQKKIDSALEGMFGKEKRFMGHLTIARPKKDIEEKEEFFRLLEALKTEKFTFTVKSFALFKSEKERTAYTKLEEFFF